MSRARGLQGGFPDVLESARDGYFRRAKAQLDELPEGLERDSAGVYLLYHAGDLEGALLLCREARLRHPQDEYLARTQQELALSLSRPEALSEVESTPARALCESQRALEQGRLRSQVLLLGFLLVMAGVLLWARRTQRGSD